MIDAVRFINDAFDRMLAINLKEQLLRFRVVARIGLRAMTSLRDEQPVRVSIIGNSH